MSGRAGSAAARASWVTTSWTIISAAARKDDRRTGRQVLLRPPPERHLHPALSQSVRRQARLPARFRLSGRARAARAGRARSRSWASARAFKDEMTTPGPWKMGATAFGEMLPNHANSVGLDTAQQGQVGPAGAQDRLRHGRERTPDAQGHDRRHGRDARADRRENGQDLRRRILPGNGASTRWARRAWAAIRRPRCSTRTIRSGTRRTSSSPTARAWLSTACQNPSLTYMALTARAVDFAVNELNRRNL